MMPFIEPDYEANSNQPISKSGLHRELVAKIKLSKKSKSLHFCSLNLDYIPSEVFSLTKLIRLDLSYNNLVKISEEIGTFTSLSQLWLNDNPLREVPTAIANCK
mmetsp:Transcript_8619/g.9795  ORF Transcript_8619/g.9795 Transcript_8619/m.9795 type:complete len:104 (+) Transcript_8619:3-314(+)